MERFIHRENIALFKRRLADPRTTEVDLEVLVDLLAKEEKLLAQSEAQLAQVAPSPRAPPQGPKR